MKPFSVASMTNMRGVFYPTGHIVLMFPTHDDARRACHLLRQDGIPEEELCLAAPEEFDRQIAGATDEDDDLLLPSAGTEAETAQRFRRLAREGHHALIVHAASGRESEHVMQVLKDLPIAYGQRYRHLVIEDLVDRK
jgi:hypothetical protein